MVINIVGGAGRTKTTDAKSAARLRHDREQCRTTVSNGPMQEEARVDRRPIAARMQCFRFMKAPCRFFLRSLQDRRAGPEANQRATHSSAANALGCLPSNGYMDITTTNTISLFRRATG